MRRRQLRVWAEELYEEYAARIAEFIGADDVPKIQILVTTSGGGGAAWTSGTDVTLSAPWFSAHPDDSGGVLHEFTHAIMRAPIYDDRTRWLIEGIADWIRDELGHDMPWTFAYFEPGAATSGYQTTAHFLRWLEARTPGTVRALSSELISGTYGPEAFETITGASVGACVSRYEQEQPA